MAGSSGSLDYWRKFFRSANSDIFDVMEHAVLVAASDYPQEFRNRRDQIAEKLFTALLTRCYGCHGFADEEGDRSVKTDAAKESKVDSSNFGPEDVNRLVSNYSYDEAEALTVEIEEESQIVGEVLRIKEIFSNHNEESDSVLFESLRRLQLMELSVEVLKATEIGKAVNCLRRHNSKQIRNLVRTLIDGWKVLVDEWVRATEAIADQSLDSLNQTVEDEEGLPSPPLDEGALFATQTNSIQFSEFFDGIDDDGNFRNNGEFGNQRESGSKISTNNVTQRKPQPPKISTAPNEKTETTRQEIAEAKQVLSRQEPQAFSISKMKGQQDLARRQSKPREPFNSQAKHEGPMNKQKRPNIPDYGLGRPQNLSSGQKAGGEVKPKRNQSAGTASDKIKSAEEASVRAKLEAAKRKLQEGYQQAENAKRMRTIQVMELHDLPKQTHNRHPNPKSKNNVRSLVNGRR